MKAPNDFTITAKGRAALTQKPTMAERLEGVAHALEDMGRTLPIIARTGKMETAVTLVGELREEVAEIAAEARAA